MMVRLGDFRGYMCARCGKPAEARVDLKMVVVYLCVDCLDQLQSDIQCVLTR